MEKVVAYPLSGEFLTNVGLLMENKSRICG